MRHNTFAGRVQTRSMGVNQLDAAYQYALPCSRPISPSMHTLLARSARRNSSEGRSMTTDGAMVSAADRTCACTLSDRTCGCKGMPERLSARRSNVTITVRHRPKATTLLRWCPPRHPRPRHRTHQLTEPGCWSLEKWRKWGKWGGEWENSGNSTRDMGCGRMWQDVVEENGTKMGEKTHFPHFSGGQRSSLPFVKISPPHSLTEKWGF